MTCIAALIDKNNDIYIGGDSFTIAENYYKLHPIPKVYIKNGVAFGFSGSTRETQIIRYVFDPPVFDKEKPLMDYLCVDFIDKLKHSIEERFQIDKDDGTHAGAGLVCMHGKIFCVGSDFSITESSDSFDAIGTGKNYALGSLYSTQDWEDGEARIKCALEAAEKFSPFCRGPFHILCLKNSGDAELK